MKPFLKHKKRDSKLLVRLGGSGNWLEPIIRKLGITSPVIIEGGTRIVDPTSGETLWQKYMEDEDAEKVFRIFKKHSDHGLVLSSASRSDIPIQEVERVASHLSFLYLLEVQPETAKAIAEQINGNMAAIAHMTPAWTHDERLDIHVTHSEATKENAIRVWQKIQDITKEETIGIGDSGNDVPIFRSSGLKIAVGNATDELKKLADFIAPAQSQGALEFVIKKFLLRQ